MILHRDSQDGSRTYGTMQTEDGTVECQTMERPWANNQPGISCIPAGLYDCTLRFSPHHGFAVYGVDRVPNRSDIEIHAANLPTQLLGCIALGQSRGPLNGQDAVLASQAAVDAFMAARGVGDYRRCTSQALLDAAHADGLPFTLHVLDPSPSEG